MPIYTIDEKNFNLSFTVICSTLNRTVTYEIRAWNKVNHKIDKYLFGDGEFEKACDKFDSLKVAMKNIEDNNEFLADLHEEQREQM